PMLKDLESADPSRHAEAVVRSAEFFNCHPYLAGLALGATVRAEYDLVPGNQIERLRTALCSPLGSLGDQIFWAGVLPALLGAAITGVVLGSGLWAVGAFLLLYNGVRFVTAVWSLQTGVSAGIRVGSAITKSWLPTLAEWMGAPAGFFVGLALPLAARWFAADVHLPVGLGMLVVIAAGVVLGRRYAAVVGSLRFGLLVLGFSLLLAWGWR
ncbi:MAG: PTS system mannose/fructose/sorbose family transporter subunit IID, partial [Gemmatimonadota bacterium]